MTIYVDTPVERQGKFNGYCHMMTDGDLQELHDFAVEIRVGLYFQNKPRFPHYDLSQTKRRLAVSLGAVEITTEEMINLCSVDLHPKPKPKSIAQLAIQEGIEVCRETGKILNPEKMGIPDHPRKDRR